MRFQSIYEKTVEAYSAGIRLTLTMQFHIKIGCDNGADLLNILKILPARVHWNRYHAYIICSTIFHIYKIQ